MSWTVTYTQNTEVEEIGSAVALWESPGDSASPFVYSCDRVEDPRAFVRDARAALAAKRAGKTVESRVAARIAAALNDEE